jgi:hypothetical protein
MKERNTGGRIMQSEKGYKAKDEILVYDLRAAEAAWDTYNIAPPEAQDFYFAQALAAESQIRSRIAFKRNEKEAAPTAPIRDPFMYFFKKLLSYCNRNGEKCKEEDN